MILSIIINIIFLIQKRMLRALFARSCLINIKIFIDPFNDAGVFFTVLIVVYAGKYYISGIIKDRSAVVFVLSFLSVIALTYS